MSRATQPSADRLLRLPVRDAGERISAWAHDRVPRRLVLTLHGDEVLSRRSSPLCPSSRALATCCATSSAALGLPRRRALARRGPGGRPTYQTRMVRNDPATLWFEGITHTAASPLVPAVVPRRADATTSTAWSNPAAERARKAPVRVRPPTARGAWRRPDERRLLHARALGGAAPKAVPAADAAAVRAVLAPPSVHASAITLARSV